MEILKKFADAESADHPFGEYEEEAIVSLILDHPEFFTTIAKHLQYKLFAKPEVQYVVARIMQYYDDYGVFPTRGLLQDLIKHELTVDSEGVDDILRIAQRPSDIREIPAIKERLLEWAKNRSYGLLYDEEVISRFQAGDYEYLEEVFNEARNIQDVGTGSMWFFDEVEKLFHVESLEKLTTGFQQLDTCFHNEEPEKGPAKSEMLVWMAPTGVGKCHTLQSKIIEKRLSRIFELELEDGQAIRLPGYRRIQTQRGTIKVCDLRETDNITEIPNQESSEDILVPNTNDFVYVDFSEIKDCWNGAEILTPSGFTPIKSFSFIKNGPTKILRLSNGMVLECDPCHKLMTKAGAKFAKDLDFDDALIGIDGDITFTINDGQPQDLYDIEIDSPHWYYTSGVLSHNSIMLVNNAVANIKRGKNVLYVTLEMSDLATALRALGAMTGKPVKKRMDYKEQIMQSISHLKNSGDIGDLVFHELPPDETSVDSLYALCDVLRRTKGWVPDVICVDYLELMVSRRASDNKDQYQRQKATATQLRGFARAENVLLFTATQTNRSGNDSSTSAPIDVTKMAESYGKSMPMDYLVSINQSLEEYEAGKDSNTGVMVYPAMARMYIAKNRFGIKFKTIAVRINYNTYKIEEHL